MQSGILHAHTNANVLYSRRKPPMHRKCILNCSMPHNFDFQKYSVILGENRSRPRAIACGLLGFTSRNGATVYNPYRT